MEMCPCGSNIPYSDCCEPAISGIKPAPTAEALMRSRYSAYVKGAISYIVETTHPDKRKDCDENVIRAWSQNSQWHSLAIVKTENGDASDITGKVEFIAEFTENRIKKTHHEVGTFQKLNGAWFYADTEMPIAKPFVRVESKISRNDPCSCGSGKKFKKCCGA